MRSTAGKFLIASLFALFMLCCSASQAQEESLFSLRGTVASTFFNPFTLQFEAVIHAPQTSMMGGYIVVCDPLVFPNCQSLLTAALGQCANLTGTSLAFSNAPPFMDEVLRLELIGFPANCTVQRSVFRFTGHIVSYIPPQTSISGQAEYDIQANGMIFHAVCDPLYSGCIAALNQAVVGSKCVSAVGDAESFLIGFAGDTTVINWTTQLFVSGSGTC